MVDVLFVSLLQEVHFLCETMSRLHFLLSVLVSTSEKSDLSSS